MKNLSILLSALLITLLLLMWFLDKRPEPDYKPLPKAESLPYVDMNAPGK